MGKELLELNHRHIQIAEYLINNPQARLTDVAEAIGMTPSWISTLTNSELFRNYLQERHKEISNPITIQLQEKLLGVAHSAVEKLGRMVDDSTDPNYILAAADKTLKSLGYGPQKGPSVQVNNVTQVSNVVNQGVLQAAREKMYRLAEEKHGSELPPAEGVQTRGGGRLGHSPAPAALVHSPEEADRAEGPGGSV